MAYQTNGVNYYTPGWNSGGYVPPNPAQPSYPFSYPQQTQYSTIQPPSIPRQINGRTISNEAEIVPNDVPMDGSFSLFPMNDYSCIYAKQWNTDGTIRTVKFVPEQVDNNSQNNTITFEQAVMDRFDSLEDAINNGPRRYKNNYRKNKPTQNNIQNPSSNSEPKE